MQNVKIAINFLTYFLWTEEVLEIEQENDKLKGFRLIKNEACTTHCTSLAHDGGSQRSVAKQTNLRITFLVHTHRVYERQRKQTVLCGNPDCIPTTVLQEKEM